MIAIIHTEPGTMPTVPPGGYPLLPSPCLSMRTCAHDKHQLPTSGMLLMCCCCYWQSKSYLSLTGSMNNNYHSWLYRSQGTDVPPSASRFITHLVWQVSNWKLREVEPWVWGDYHVTKQKQKHSGIPNRSCSSTQGLKTHLRSSYYNPQWNKSWSTQTHTEKNKNKKTKNSYLFTSGMLRAQPAAKSGYLKTVGFSEKA